MNSPLEYRCEHGHRWSTRPAKHIYEQTWCPQCLSGRPVPEAQVRTLVESRGFELIGSFEGSNRKMTLRNKRLLKPVVKLLKHWNASLPETARVRSFLIETIAVTLFRNECVKSLVDGLIKFFDFLASHVDQAKVYEWRNTYGIALNWWATKVPDIAGTGTNVAAGLDGERRRKFLEQAVTSRDGLLMAYEARTVAAAQRYVDAALRIGPNRLLLSGCLGIGCVFTRARA